MDAASTTRIRGGGFVIDEPKLEWVVTPEDFTSEQRLFADTTKAFVEGDVLQHDEEIERLNYELTVQLMRKAGELGLLAVDIPEAFGGLGLDKVSSTIVNENLAKASSFALSIGAHVGIGTLPIVYFGTEQQKRTYLPQLATGAKIAAYCLTEPASGSDALGARTTAKLTEDGAHYTLNGSKLYITNAGFADIFIVYAKVDGEKFTAFIVERGMEGFTVGPEEKKMGIKGSSTCPIYFDNMRVPVDNVLGEIGKGHLIAFNILNIGRFKLGAGCLGAAKETIQLASAYANARTQFGKPISSFPLIGKKLAEMNTLTYVLESMVYRTSGYIDAMLQGLHEKSTDTGTQGGTHTVASPAKAIAEFALECSIIKVFGSEALHTIADEGVQIHGGYGYTQEYKVERIYRDARINRIFEGTNEINRLLIPGTLLKKALKGELPLMERLERLQEEVLAFRPSLSDSEEDPLSVLYGLLNQMKTAFLVVGGTAVQKYGTRIEEQQEVLSALADMMIYIYAAESAILRTNKLINRFGEEKAALAMRMTQVFVRDSIQVIEQRAKETLHEAASGDVLRTQLSLLKKFSRTSPLSLISQKRDIAVRVIANERYIVM
ncbi:acyl-CoA dehydrogenase family protein [Paenibacillus alvei]|uniref:Acyl-CoA dehydrogenase family protein n=1 Tax=Paenibacillus alvei TaxID=44250 RepID=A0ABT4H1W9_PAEAL|nr:acyl-CoA dehydrogenase family protein [Paenibacillus alvei]EJW15513.1 putative acyl-CoA dehydrogenase FadE [Paenibacillus alvei DSM 29]MCY9542505.1 acyl-CoA dehydrogenase family protein [Paenibacillus alvei]MCY9706606.1 acyl-CoA dehydrogenase family protein [Paenibacillus alvei]MCY9736576.1 acyl-CoA dehydrogenase family protein [Paenibacillus alvei]MCY9757989.1 acyl-CoA dehydrogenase family protein [Paenibacillus alvei]